MDRPDILYLDTTLNASQVHGLINVCDAYVSLHRSEGFGRGMAEAMLAGKPVICTAWSGNMDFCTEANSCLIPFTLRPLRDGEYPFWEGQVWAKPDVPQAAEWMRRLVNDPDGGEALGRRARADMIEHHSAGAVGARYVQALTRLNCLPLGFLKPK